VQLARHFEQAGLTGKAVNYLLQAGKQASRLSANEEAIVHLTRGFFSSNLILFAITDKFLRQGTGAAQALQ
jgi:hypothetical protein